jgi:DNA-binding NarL/FixJ family response regulator
MTIEQSTYGHYPGVAPSEVQEGHVPQARTGGCVHEGSSAATTIENAVLIVDDDANFRRMVAHVLARAGMPSVQAPNGEDALKLASASRPTAVLLDVHLPDIDGFEVCRELRDRFGNGLPVLFVSGERVESHDRTAGLLLGGDDYLVKPVDPDELVARVRRAIARTQNGKRERRAERRDDLTPREVEVLSLLAHGLDPTEIANELVISPKTVASHLQSVMSKLGVHSRAHAVARAYEGGLIASNSHSTP